MRSIRLLLIAMVVALASAPARAQYSAVITSHPNASVTLGAYQSSLLQRSGNGVRSSAPINEPSFHRHSRWHDSRSDLTFLYGYPLYDYPWPYYLDTGPGPLGPFFAPPLYVPPEHLGFGPQAVRRFMGIDPVQQPVLNRNIVVLPGAADKANDVKAAPPGLRRSNAEARDRSRRFMEFGDAQFVARNLAEAYDRYKKAAEAAPDLAEPYFRLGHVQADMGRYEQAATAFRRGLALDPDWPTRGFRLDELYHGNQAARNATLDALKRAAEAKPGDANVQFVAGVQFYFDGQTDEARTYLERAKALGEPAANVEPFLKLLNRPQQPAELDI